MGEKDRDEVSEICDNGRERERLGEKEREEDRIC